MNAGNIAVSRNVRASGWRERFDLEILDVVDPQGAVIARAPVVDGWLQVDAVVLRVPDTREERAFFQELAALRDVRGDGYWFFVRKAPGLRMRFKLGADRARDAQAILEHLLNWHAPWLGEMALGSFFAQSELLDVRYRESVDAILTAAADELIEVAIVRDAAPNVDAWASFVLQFVEHFVGDRWFAWQVLGRFQRLRSYPLSLRGTLSETEPEPAGQVDFRDPRGMVGRLVRKGWIRESAGFGASVAMLQSLNYIFNMWAVEDVAQRVILMRARTLSAPELTL